MSITIEDDLTNDVIIDSTKRIASIDFVKGFAIVWIILAHSALSWFDKDWRYIYGLVFAFMDVMGPSLFVFLSALSVVFSVRRKKGKLPEKVIRNGILMRGMVIIIIGVLFNPLSLQTAGETVPFPTNLWGWNILMFIGFSQIISYYVLKLKRNIRAILGVLIIYFSPWFRDFLYVGKSAENVFPFFRLILSFLHFIIVSPLPQVPILPYVAVCFICTIFGEYLYDAMVQGTSKAYYDLVKKFLIYGFILVFVGIFAFAPRGVRFDIWEAGWALQVPADTISPGTIIKSEYLHIDLLRIANQQDYYQFPGMPLFMIRCTAHNMFYNLGIGFLFVALCFYLIDIKKKINDVSKLVIFYGKTSLSMFLIQYLFLPLYLGQFSIIFMPILYVAYCGFLGLLMYIWLKFFDGVGTPEWIMSKVGSSGKTKKNY
ncbi:MAG: heparan-alpha-glucosaminide N-acetyltransferase domain-containing protein [Promethearchaeota archaeon]